MGRRKLCAWTKFEILPLSTCRLRQQKSYISKGIQPIFEIFAWARRCWGWAFGCKGSGAQAFFLLQWQGENCAHRKNLKFTRFQPVHCTLWLQKSYISKSIQQIFEIFASTRRCWEWAFGWKVLGAQVFYFCNGKAKILRIDNIWNFATFNLYTVPAKILYLQEYSTNSQNLCLSSKMLRASIWVGSFRCADILVLQWQGENFAHRQNLKFCHFQLLHCASKNPISPKVFNRFSKSLPELENV